VTGVRSQQFVAHVFAAAEGRDADTAWDALGEIWRGCGPLFGMTASIARTSLPVDFPDHAVVRGHLASGREVGLAARHRPGAMCQALLRLHHDVLNLSVGMAPAERPDEGHPSWQDLDYQWNLLAGPHVAGLLGEARVFLAKVDAETEVDTAAPALFTTLSELLPGGSPGSPAGIPAGVPLPGGFAVWETASRPDERPLRRLLVAFTPQADAAASAWAWSDSTTAIPPLARYLLHAAKIRYELRVWQRDGQARRLRESLDALGAELHRAATVDTATRELLRLRRMDAALHRGDLLAMCHTVEIARDNLGRAVGLGRSPTPGGMFADDVALAGSLAERLRDEAAYLAIAMDRAAQLAELLPSAPSAPAPVVSRASPSGAGGVGTEAERRRNVLVVYGRDDAARQAVFDFLRSLGLHPLEWEELVKATGKMAPFLSESVTKGLEIAAAAVVLLAPEDIVRLHAELCGPGGGDGESAEMMQARPNVFLELGMALAAKPEATLILVVGEHRPATDLGGMSYVRLTDNPECRSRIADRLKGAGCAVSPVGTDWLTAGNFAGLAAQRRRP
jgi:predicted nucleotide-binding protein